MFYLNHTTIREDNNIEYHKENINNINDPKQILIGGLPLSLCFRAIKRELLVNSSAYSIKEKLTLLEDGCVSIEATLKAKKSYLIDEYLYQYNRESNSQSNSLSGYKSLTIALDFIYKMVKNNYPMYSEEVDYFVFTNTIMKILLNNTKEYGKDLYNCYINKQIKNNKYIKMKHICEFFAKIKVKK